MRNFIDYVERTKSEVEGEDYTDLFLEGFSQDLMKVENLDAIKAFILGFFAGSGIDLKTNKNSIESLISKAEFKNIGEIIKNLKTDEGMDIASLKKRLGKSLNQLKPIITKEMSMSEK
jgi:hypothetical protein